MDYSINLGSWRSVFAVPSEVVDRHLRLAGAAQLKTLLYLLRHSGEGVDIETLSAAIGLSAADTADAVGYWVACGLLSGGEKELLPACAEAAQAGAEPTAPVTIPATDTADAPAPAPDTQTEEAPPMPQAKHKERIRYSYSECCGMMSEDSELQDMLKLLEGLMSRQLSYSEISVFITLVKWYGMQPASVVLLTEYCRSIGKLSLAYIERAGCGWADDGIVTVEQANDKILRLRAARSAWNVLRATLGIPERTPSSSEEKYSGIWINEWHTDTELIKLAYDRCVDTKGKISLSYMNGIITSWRKKELYSIEQVMQADTRPEGKESPAKGDKAAARQAGRYSPTYDKDEIESMLDDEWGSDD